MKSLYFTKHFSQLTLEELYRIMQLREEVFFMEQHVDCPDADNIDCQCIFICATIGGRIVGTVRVIPKGLVYEMPSAGRLCVGREWRRRGIARRLIELAQEFVTQQWHEKSLEISAQLYLLDFYTSMGFQVVSDEYLDGGLPHRKMIWRSE